MQTAGGFSLLIKDVICSSVKKKLEVKGVPNSINSKVFIRKITAKEIDYFKNEQHILLHKNQIVFDIFVPNNYFLKYVEEVSLLVEWLLFSFILSLDDICIIWEKNGSRCKISGKSGLGVGLPLVVFKFISNGGVNLYYANDAEKTSTTGEYFISYKPKQLKAFQKIVIGRNVVNLFIPSAMVNIYTLNWVKEGFFLQAVVILSSCYELLTEKGYQKQKISSLIKTKFQKFNLSAKQISNLDRFQFLRNAIAHPSGYKISRKSKIYSITETNGKHRTETFAFDEISEVRKILIHLVRTAYNL